MHPLNNNIKKILLKKPGGLTLVELLVAMTIVGIIALAAMPLLSSSIEAHNKGMARSRLYHEGLLIIERITTGLKKTTILLVPNGHTPTRDILAYSRLVNTDNDFYFGDPLFPRIDEDPPNDFSSGSHGVLGIDEDGDGSIDEGSWDDEDEDGNIQEDFLNGLDDDGDGSIDEEAVREYNQDNMPGIVGIDDDGDGTVDEDSNKPADDDEDGVLDEEEILFVVYTHDSANNTLTEIYSDAASGINNPAPKNVLSDRVTVFEAKHLSPTDIKITLRLQGEDGEEIEFVENVYPRNTLQRTGKWVR
jgi:prepilin-type N-terminal cleavage/methylation domain-containing protein